MAKKVTTEMFIEKVKSIHGDVYDYSNVKYKNNLTKVDVVCPEHGHFFISPANHIAGSACKKCHFDSKRKTLDEFIKEANLVHDNLYDYSKVIYKNTNTKITIVCREHGDFEQLPTNHIYKGHKCPLCTNNKKFTRESFIERANELHNFKYDYSKFQLLSMTDETCVICPIHGETLQQPRNHIRTEGCPKCSLSNLTSKAMNEIISMLNGFDYELEKTFSGCVNKRKLPFDIYIETLNLCIEYDGRQHFEPIEFWGGIDGLKQTQANDNIKNKFCYDNSINIIRIRYDEDHTSVLKEYFKNTFNMDLRN